jgi:hypothetical protein
VAYFQASARAPTGFDVNDYALSLFPDNGRFACLFDTMPKFDNLNLVALTTKDGPGPGNPASPVAKVRKDIRRGDDNGTDPDFQSDLVRRYCIHGLKRGEAFLHVLDADDEDYCEPLKIKVGTDRGDMDVMQKAFRDSRAVLFKANQKLLALQMELIRIQGTRARLSEQGKTTYFFCERWLKAPPLNTTDRASALRGLTVVQRAQVLVQNNLAGSATFVRTPDPTALGLAGIGTGVEMTDRAFGKGPVCRASIMTHEFFHLVGLGHGEEPGKVTPRWPPELSAITSPEMALNSAYLLTALVNEMTATEVLLTSDGSGKDSLGAGACTGNK